MNVKMEAEELFGETMEMMDRMRGKEMVQGIPEGWPHPGASELSLGSSSGQGVRSVGSS